MPKKLFDWPEDWKLFDFGTAFPWQVGEKTRTRLAVLMSLPANMWQGCPEEVNKRLRIVVGPKLSTSARYDIAKWIICDWGGIKRHNSRKLHELIDVFRDFSPHAISDASQRLGNDRISSWSKLTSFALPDSFAILDARVAVALNCALHSKGCTERFSMPFSRNGTIKAVRARLCDRKASLTYDDYLAELHTAREPLGKSLLALEATLFANAPVICGKWLQEHTS